MTFFGCKFGFGKCFGASQSNHWAGQGSLSYRIHFLLHITIWSRNGLLLLHRTREGDTSKNSFFWFVVSSWVTHLLSLFTFPICFKCWTTIVHIEFFGSFLCSCKRISFGDHSQLVVVNFWWLATMLLIVKALVSIAKLPEPLLPVCSLAVPGLNVLLMLQVVSTALWPILN